MRASATLCYLFTLHILNAFTILQFHILIRIYTFPTHRSLYHHIASHHITLSFFFIPSEYEFPNHISFQRIFGGCEYDCDYEGPKIEAVCWSWSWSIEYFWVHLSVSASIISPVKLCSSWIQGYRLSVTAVCVARQAYNVCTHNIRNLVGGFIL